VIEIFSRNAKGLELNDGQHIIPNETGSAERLSAILLDDAYFNLIRGNLYMSEQGHHVINVMANICLKARAFPQGSCILRSHRVENLGRCGRFERH
jgi:hypothetical protein